MRNTHFRDNILFIMISVAAFLTQPTILNAQQYPYKPTNFTEPLQLSRGVFSPASRSAVYLNKEDRCHLLVEEQGWDSCETVEAFVVGHAPGIDSLLVMSPNSEGHIKFDDWDSKDKQAEIKEIWESFVEGTKQQGKRIGKSIKPIRWYVYPTLEKEKSYLYYAILLDWDGNVQINAKATFFDRRGHVPMSVIPSNSAISEVELKALVETALSSYSPNPKQSYFDFQEGDKVAAAGALGVLATLVGVKYGKGIFAALMGLLLLVAKKAWFILLLPFMFLKKLFKKKQPGDGS